MRITHKIAAALVLVLVALLAGAAIILDGAVRPGFERLEQSLHQRNQARVAANLAAIADDMRSRVTDYAYWDDTYAFVAEPDPDYLADFTDQWLVDYGIDIAVFVDSSGRVLWRRAVDANGVVGDDPQTAAQLASFAASRSSGRAARAGVVWLPDLGFAMVSLARATRSDGGGEPRGWVIMGKRLTAAALSQQTQMRVDLISAAAPGDMASRMQGLDRGAPEIWRTRDTIYALSAVRDPYGEIIGAILMQQPREAMALGARSIGVALLLFAGAVVLAVAALWILLRTLVVRRLERLEAHLRAQDGEPRHIPTADVAGHDEISRLTEAYNALVGRLSDVGAREQAALIRQEAEAAANRAKSDFLANVSHELRRPLDAIMGYTELIGEELQGADAARSRADLDRIAESARRLLALIGEILDISRVDAGRLELRLETFRVGEMVHALDAAQARGGATRVEVVGDLGTARTDQRRLNQSLANAILAARTLTAQGPVILRASRRDDVLRFDVQAAGVSLTPDQLAHALDPLSGAHKPSSRLAGSGLALVVARKLLSMLGGALEVRNSPEGVTFALTAAALLQDTSSSTGTAPSAAA